MQEHAVDAMARSEEARRSYIRAVAQVSPTDELAELKEEGVRTEAEFAAQKARFLSA